MLKAKKIELISYEYIVYIHLLETINVDKILLTTDNQVDIESQGDNARWVPAENIEIFVIDNVRVGDDTAAGDEKRICGLFDAEPLDWKYARITVGDYTNTTHRDAMARMPRSPTLPVFFDIKE